MRKVNCSDLDSVFSYEGPKLYTSLEEKVLFVWNSSISYSDEEYWNSSIVFSNTEICDNPKPDSDWLVLYLIDNIPLYDALWNKETDLYSIYLWCLKNEERFSFAKYYDISDHYTYTRYFLISNDFVFKFALPEKGILVELAEA